eukprot:4787400-Pleurochrysis_carterae.AAC.2
MRRTENSGSHQRGIRCSRSETARVRRCTLGAPKSVRSERQRVYAQSARECTLRAPESKLASVRGCQRSDQTWC